jgi:hypothetical protein
METMRTSEQPWAFRDLKVSSKDSLTLIKLVGGYREKVNIMKVEIS